MVQLDNTSPSEGEDCRFESCWVRQKILLEICFDFISKGNHTVATHFQAKTQTHSTPYKQRVIANLALVKAYNSESGDCAFESRRVRHQFSLLRVKRTIKKIECHAVAICITWEIYFRFIGEGGLNKSIFARETHNPRTFIICFALSSFCR